MPFCQTDLKKNYSLIISIYFSVSIFFPCMPSQVPSFRPTSHFHCVLCLATSSMVPGEDGECIQTQKCLSYSWALRLTTAVPSAPYDITCLESFRDSMVLGWKQPDTTGGAEITGYYVNYREVVGEVPGKWREANIKAVSDAAYKVSRHVPLWPD